jgi:hypothetical protein
MGCWWAHCEPLLGARYGTRCVVLKSVMNFYLPSVGMSSIPDSRAVVVNVSLTLASLTSWDRVMSAPGAAVGSLRP